MTKQPGVLYIQAWWAWHDRCRLISLSYVAFILYCVSALWSYQKVAVNLNIDQLMACRVIARFDE